MKVKTDALDESILDVLKKDGRTSYREIGRQLNVSESAVRQRIRKLQNASAIRIGVVMDLSSSGRTVVGWVRISVNPAQLDKVVEQLVALEETTYVATTVGEHNILVVLPAPDIEGLYNLVDDSIAALRGVEDVDVRIVANTLKYEFHQVALTNG